MGLFLQDVIAAGKLISFPSCCLGTFCDESGAAAETDLFDIYESRTLYLLYYSTSIIFYSKVEVEKRRLMHSF
jgi:hypothetical protein